MTIFTSTGEPAAMGALNSDLALLGAAYYRSRVVLPGQSQVLDRQKARKHTLFKTLGLGNYPTAEVSEEFRGPRLGKQAAANRSGREGLRRPRPPHIPTLSPAGAGWS